MITEYHFPTQIYVEDIPKWLQRGLGQNEAAVKQTGKTGLVVVSWVNKAKRRYFGLFEINQSLCMAHSGALAALVIPIVIQ